MLVVEGRVLPLMTSRRSVKIKELYNNYTTIFYTDTKAFNQSPNTITFGVNKILPPITKCIPYLILLSAIVKLIDFVHRFYDPFKIHS